MNTRNTFMADPFVPVVEETTAFDLPVTGRIPNDLVGRYLRIGPNALGVEDPSSHLWTSGEGMVHGVRLSGGTAQWYRNRWVRSAGVLERLGEPPRPTGLKPEQDFAPNVHVISHGSKTLALVEAGAVPYEMGYELETVGPSRHGVTDEGFSPNAHSKVDPRTGDLHSVAYIPSIDFAQHIVTDPAGVITAVNHIPTSADTPYMHDFALTENYVIVFDTPLHYNMAALESGLGPDKALQWDSSHSGRVGVVSRADGKVRWLESDPSHVSHILNSHEDGSTIVVDLIRVDGPVNVFDTGDGRPTLDRWTIDLATGTVRIDRLDDRPQDFPRINEAVVSRPYRFGYSTVSAFYRLPFPLGGNHPDVAFSNALVKHDLQSGTTQVHGFAADAAVSEAAFAAAPDASEEDDGYLMAYIHNPERGASDLIILSAQDFTGDPLARVHLPVRVPLGLHGSWVPDV